jgi:hypothetical protein
MLSSVMKHVILFVTTMQVLHFDHSRLIESWQIKWGGLCGAGCMQNYKFVIGFVINWSGQKGPEEPKQIVLTPKKGPEVVFLNDI